MKTYKVKVNGKKYIVELESVEESASSIETKETVKVEEKKPVSSSEGCTDVLAPIQGNVLDIIVKVGQKVKKGDVLLLIEAMKLENEVNSSIDGEVVEILVSKSQTVSAGELLVKIK